MASRTPWSLLGLLSVTLVARPLVSATPVAAAATTKPAAKAREDYKRFRTLSIDMLQRMPTREELVDFERPDFDLGAWIDARLDGSAYASRLARVYLDALRLELSPDFNYTPEGALLRRREVHGAGGKPVYVYYRPGQRRIRPETDGDFCLTNAEQSNVDAIERATVLVKPWWLYRDYREADPKLLYGAGWKDADPLYQPADAVRFELDGSPTVAIRICREEASTNTAGHVFLSGRTTPQMLPGRTWYAPIDDPGLKKHAGESVSCDQLATWSYSTECGCGVGLERCLPCGPWPSFVLPQRLLQGQESPTSTAAEGAIVWFRLWLAEDAKQFVTRLFAEDRDFREILTGRWDYVNGPMAQFDRWISSASCCSNASWRLGQLTDSQPLVDPSHVPDLAPYDVGTWRRVDDRGPRASGILTLPAFLAKYASRRARAAALWTTFTCNTFTATEKPSTSNDVDLARREGCRGCHATIEPLAAYFTRISEASSWTYLPSDVFPLESAVCKKVNGKISPTCTPYYDPQFTDEAAAFLRGAHPSKENAALGVEGAAAEIVARPEFAKCAVRRVYASLVGHVPEIEDEATITSLAESFVRSGYRPRALVGAILRSDAYARSTDVGSAALTGGAP